MSLIEQIDKRGVGPQHKSIIDRCTALVYPEAENAGRVATLCDLRQKLLEQPEDKAREIALSWSFTPPVPWTSLAGKARWI